MKFKTIHYQGVVYRAHNPRWSYDPTSGKGAARHGGRFNPRGAKALYTSEDFNTAVLEAQQGFALKFQPLTICAYNIDCTDVVDLTTTPVPYDLGCAWEELTDLGQRPPTWALYDELRAQAVSAVRVRSFAANSTPANINIIFWDWAHTPPHKVVVIDDEKRLRKP
ncbi:MAG: RES domain-containing protein [Rhodospirillales bacterium]|nr:RES domain-containing protein [Rhodospirillales bacterium]